MYKVYKVKYEDNNSESHCLYKIYYSVTDTCCIVNENGDILFFEDDTFTEVSNAIFKLARHTDEVEEVNNSEIPDKIIKLIYS